MRFFGARATANLRRRPPQFKIHFVPAPFPDDCAHLHEFIRNERREPALFRVPRRSRAYGCSVVYRAKQPLRRAVDFASACRAEYHVSHGRSLDPRLRAWLGPSGPRLRSNGDVYRAANDHSTGRDVLFQHRLYAMFVLHRCAGSGAPFGRVRGLRFPPAGEMGAGALPGCGGLRHFLPAAALCRFQWIRILRLILVVALGVALPFILWPKITQRETTVDLLAKGLQRYARPDDLIIVSPWFLGPSFSWYYHGQTRWMTLPELSEKRIHRYDLIKTKMEESDPIAD